QRLHTIVSDLGTPVPSIAAQRPDLGRLGVLIDGCLVKRREERIESAQLLLSELESLIPPRLPSDAETSCPYPGLAPFQELDASRLFGREALIAELMARLVDQPLIAILGPSGSGKSSFVRAGVIPALKRSGDAWDALVVRPGPQPFHALADFLLHRAPADA